MEKTEIQAILASQRAFFSTGATHSLNYRIQALQHLKTAVQRHEKAILTALEQDLGKSRFEGYMCEVGMVCSELSYMIRHLRSLAAETCVSTPLAQFPARSYTKPVPYGVTLIMSPWNYPFMLAIGPLADALAAGNTAVLKPSAYSPNTSRVIQDLIAECFSPSYVTVIPGGRAENTFLLQEQFDYIFFTGSQAVGKEVLRHAAEHLTPVTLELGGKSPCIVDSTAKIPLAAKRIVFGKFLNCGQTCVAPDYILCDRSIHDQLIRELIYQIERQFGSFPLDNPNYGKIINSKHFERIRELVDLNKVVFGSASDPETCRFEPMILDVAWDDPIMQEEIFGPILPVLTYRSLSEAVRTINDSTHHIALYLFSSSKKRISYVTEHCQFGGGCVNDTIIHLATPHMGFGGVGASGMGAYHGKTGFETFSHRKSIVHKKTWLDLPMRYQPYRKCHERIIRQFLK